MSAARNMLRAISPQRVLVSSPKLKFKLNDQHTPTTHKINSNLRNKKDGSQRYLSPGGLHSTYAIDSEIQNLQHGQKSNDVSPGICVHVTPSNAENVGSEISYSLPTYLSVPGINKLPLSPSMFDCFSPIPRTSLVCQNTSPSGYLYTPDRQESCLGRGSFGNVTLCTYESHQFALKIIHCPKTSRIGERNLVGIHHVNVVRVLRVYELMDKVFICMEFAGHCNLQQLLDDKTDLDFVRRLGFAEQVAAGLNHCHQSKIAHGDLKPLNVVVSPKGVCKLGDFGLSIQVDAKENTAPNPVNFAGTAAYAAPEMLKGMQPSLEADIYSLGITLWQIYSMETPFAGEHPHVIIYKVVSRNARPIFKKSKNLLKDEYTNLSAKCWDKDPVKRPTSENVLINLKNQLAVVKNNLPHCKS